MQSEKSPHINIGIIGENIACKFLENKGYKIIERNFRGDRIGEIDIICKKDGVIVFVEVKTLVDHKNGLRPEENVTPDKQKKLIRCCRLYLGKNRIDLDTDWQIDVVSIKLDRENKKAKVRHIQNAVY